MIQDYLGNEVKPNDRIVYPVRRGSSLRLWAMLVSSVADGVVMGVREDGRSVRVLTPNNIVVCPFTNIGAASAAQSEKNCKSHLTPQPQSAASDQ